MSRQAPHSTSLSGLTPDAQGALERAGLSRRAFLQGAGVLIVSFSALGKAATAGAQLFGARSTPGAPSPDQLDSWIAIAADGRVTAYTGKSEIGQGISTAQMQLVAEELCVPFDNVHLIYCETPITPDEGVTSGSQSHPTNFNHRNLAQAAATARETLMQLGSRHLGVPAASLVARDGAIHIKNQPAKKVGYGTLIGGKHFDLHVDPHAKRKPASEWTILGTPAKQPDLPAIVTGQFEFVHNVRLPGMLHGEVVRPPEVGATVIGVDEGSVSGMPGVVKVVVRKNFVGVVAQKPWQAIQAAKKLKVRWSPGKGLPPQANYYEHLRNQKPTRDSLSVDSKDVPEKLAAAATVLKATYYYPYQMHGSMGTSCAVADVRGNHATIYSPTQGVWPLRGSLAMLLGLDQENVKVLFRRGAGCYGLNGADAVSYDAAILSQAVGKPVRVQLSRKDEMAWENFGYAFVMDERAGLDAHGNIVAWEHEAWFPVHGSRPGYDTPGNVITGALVGFQSRPFEPRSPAPEPRRFENHDNSVPSYCAGKVGDKSEGTGTIESERVLIHTVPSPFFTGPLRSPARLQNTFAHESFMDELAAQAKVDPVAFRLRHLSFPRLRDVVTAAAGAAKCDARPSPKPDLQKTGVASGRGMACVAYEGGNGYTAVVAEVAVDQDSGRIVVKRFVVSIDVGPISNPDGLKNQMEGGALQGMSRVLGEEVTWDDRKVTSIDWATYHTQFLGIEVPQVDVVLLNRPDDAATGAGETSITVVAAAIGNAVFDATGARLREAPFTSDRVKAALKLRA
ncbi:MAG: xanthine dehydrogenase family protein molybdopterin-binding subunit [Acidobacteriota bacterium]|nr:xanthine dehydrogenase family protein molybdopterin-binding subunit [Acidobacteriota bacterium]